MRKSWSMLLLVAFIGCASPAQQDEFDIRSLGEQGSISEAVPFNDQTPRTGQVRLRVWFVGNAPELPSLGVRSVYLCGTGCTRLGSAKTVAPTDDGAGALYADGVIAPQTFDRIVVQPDRASGATFQFKLERLAVAVEMLADEDQALFLSIKQDATAALAPSFLASDRVAKNAEKIVVYRPDRDLALRMNSGASATIAAGALPKPTVIAANESETGEYSNALNLLPAVATASPVAYRLPVDAQQLPDGLQPSDYKASVNDIDQPVTISANQASFSAATLGRVELGTTREIVTTDAGQHFAMPDIAPAISALGNTAQCKKNLAANLVKYDKTLNTHPFPTALMTDVCKKIAPHVYIVIMKTDDARAGLQIAITPKTNPNAKHDYDLRTISEHAQSVGAFAAVNGFVWDGDQGDDKNQTGSVLSTLITNGVSRNVSTQKEAMLGFSKNTGQGTSAAMYLRDTVGGVVDFGVNNHNVVASTTSIIKNGACSQQPGGQSNTWSAVGIGKNRLVFVSSAKGEDSDASELCSVFEGLGALDGALRLDGNSAASIYFDGKHRNPLGFPKNRIYSSARRVAYALAWVRTTPAGESVNIAPSSFNKTNSKWSKSGPAYTGGGSGTHDHTYGGGVGGFSYDFDLKKVSGTKLEVSARVSSEFPPGVVVPADGSSDVEVLVNGVSVGVQSVIPDNISGKQTVWKLESNPLKAGKNTVEFVVKDTAAHRNGLCIYQKAIKPNELDAKIVITQLP